MAVVLFNRPVLPWPAAQLVGASSHTPQGSKFDSGSVYIYRLWVQSPVGVHTGSDQLMFLSHINVSLSLSLSFPLTPSLSLKSINISSVEDLKKKEEEVGEIEDKEVEEVTQEEW